MFLAFWGYLWIILQEILAKSKTATEIMAVLQVDSHILRHFLHLMTDDQVLIVIGIVGTVPKTVRQKPGHLILIQIFLAGVAFIILIIDIVGAGITAGSRLLLFFTHYPLSFLRQSPFGGESFLLLFYDIIAAAFLYFTAAAFFLSMSCFRSSFDHRIQILLFT